MRGKAHGESTRAAVLAALLEGEPVGVVARRFGVPQQTVSTWRAHLDPARFGELQRKKEERFAALLARYLEDTLVTMTAQAVMMRDPAWLDRQRAGALGVLHGQMLDRAFRLLGL